MPTLPAHWSTALEAPECTGRPGLTLLLNLLLQNMTPLTIREWVFQSWQWRRGYKNSNMHANALPKLTSFLRLATTGHTGWISNRFGRSMEGNTQGLLISEALKKVSPLLPLMKSAYMSLLTFFLLMIFCRSKSSGKSKQQNRCCHKVCRQLEDTFQEWCSRWWVHETTDKDPHYWFACEENCGFQWYR